MEMALEQGDAGSVVGLAVMRSWVKSVFAGHSMRTRSLWGLKAWHRSVR